MYKVMWIDDEHERLEGVKEEADEASIKIIGFTNAEESAIELKKNPNKYQAVILDGLFYRKSNQQGSALNQEAFGEVARVLTELKAQNILIPWFIYSGQTSFVKSKNVLVDIFKEESFARGKVFDKNEDEDLPELFFEIKKAIKQTPFNVVRNKYSDAFKIFEKNFLEIETENSLIKLIINMNDEFKIEQAKNEFNKLRKIIELLVDKCFEKKLIPEEFKRENFTKIIYFLSGKDKDYRLRQNYFHPTINLILPTLWEILQDGSHAKNNMRYNVNEFAQIQANGYFLNTCIYQLFDILIGFNNIFEKQNNGKMSNNLWFKVEKQNLVEGQIEQDEDGNYHCFEYLLPFMKIESYYKVGDRIRVVKEVDNTVNKTKHLYPKFACDFENI